MIKCNLTEDVNTCMHYNKINKTCSYKSKCSFQRSEEDNNKTTSKEKWYKKYYKNWN